MRSDLEEYQGRFMFVWAYLRHKCTGIYAPYLWNEVKTRIGGDNLFDMVALHYRQMYKVTGTANSLLQSLVSSLPNQPLGY